MDRKISYNDVVKAVDEAYEQFKSLKDGAVDDTMGNAADAGKFGISLMLTDGRVINKGDTELQFVLGPVSKLPLSVVLLSQNTPEELVKKSGKCCCKCKQNAERPKVDLPFGLHGVRAVSAVEPTGDREGKMAVLNDMIFALTNAEPAFSDALYKHYKDALAKDDAAQALSAAGTDLKDDAALSADLYARLRAMMMNTKQLAAMGATVAADGRNPLTGNYAFDGAIAADVVAMMATHGKHFVKPWMLITGMPAKKSRSGAIVAVLPGFGAIAAYAPEVNELGVSVKGAHAIKYIADKLGLNVFASARVEVEK